MSDRPTDEPISLAKLETRHDELLAQLDELDQRIQTVLKEHLPQKRVEETTLSAECESASPAAALTVPERRAA